MTSEAADISINDMSLKHFHVNAECPHGEGKGVETNKDKYVEMTEEEKIMRQLEILQSRGKTLRYDY